jgi:hypothetical protein
VRRRLICECGNKDDEDVATSDAPFPICSADCGKTMTLAPVQAVVLGVVLAHRCPRHIGVAPLNREADNLIRRRDDKDLACRPLLDIEAECGACLAEEVEASWSSFLEAIEILSALLWLHARDRRPPITLIGQGDTTGLMLRTWAEQLRQALTAAQDIASTAPSDWAPLDDVLAWVKEQMTRGGDTPAVH